MHSRREFIDHSFKTALGLVGGIALTRGATLMSATGTPGRTIRDFTLTAGAGEWDVGSGKTVRALTYNGRLPGPELRVREGDVVRVTLRNALTEPTTIHWHGIPVPFAMDGVPELTQPAVPPGGTFVYEFVAGVPGTYWYHSHVAYQFERGLFGALVVEPARESLAYDREFTLVLDDWLRDAANPVASAMPYNMSVGGVIMGAMEEMQHTDNAGTPASDAAPRPAPANGGAHALHGDPMREPVFDDYTVNGRVGRAHPPLVVRRGDRVRLRLVNAATATVFPIYLAGHRLTVTHSDGQPITPYETDVVAVGMGERIDVLVTATNPGAWRLTSSDAKHRAKGLDLVMRYEGVRPDATVTDGPVPRISNLPYQGAEGTLERTSSAAADREYRLALRMESPDRWTINGKVYPDVPPLEVKQGERVRIRLVNNSMFAHPMHLHGHFFDVVQPYGASADVRRPLRKDTITLYHMDTHVIEFLADNPGSRWFFHCHNQYHHVGGMAAEVRYV